MEKHPFHKAIGNLLRLPDSWTIEILKDPACDTNGRRIPLYLGTLSMSVHLCDVDMLIESEGVGRVIIEIEESNVKPINILGKFFASAYSDSYKDKGGKIKPLDEYILFIQVLDSSKLKSKSKKREQWEIIAQHICQAIREPLFNRKWQYELCIGDLREYMPKNREGKGLLPIIKEFLGVV